MADVVVIGAGPGGSVTALVLAQAGVRVMLVEQARFPRDKVCGECLSALGWEVLERVGLSARVRGLGAVPIRRVIVCAGDGAVAEMELPSPMWGVSRKALDEPLLEAARQAGVEVRQPIRCERVDGGDGVRVSLRDLTSNAVEVTRARWAVVAEGKSALVRPKPPATADLGVKAHFAGLRWETDAVGLFGVRGHYGGVAPIESGLWNFATSVPAERVEAFGGDLDRLFNAMVSENRALRRCLTGGRRVTPWLASALPRFAVRTDWPRGVVPVGNAAAAIEPIGGEGMGLAMRSGELAGHEIASALRDEREVDAGRLRSEYRKLWQARGWGCRAAGWMFSQKELCEAGIALAENSVVEKVGLWLIGK